MTLSLQHLLLIALGGAAGSVMRYLTAGFMQRWMESDFPYGTLMVNVIGSFVMGFLYTLLIERFGLAEQWRALLLVGLLGGFTTFSAFSMDTMILLQQGQWFKAVLYISASVAACLLVAWLGIQTGRSI